MKVLITGATGFVGRHLAAELLRSGHEVLLTNITAERVAIAAFGQLDVQALDITNFESCQTVIGSFDPDAVIHLAGIAQTTGQPPELLTQVNVHGAENVARALALLPKKKDHVSRTLLFVSSAFVYGDGLISGAHYFSEGAATQPRGPYGASKLAAEAAVAKYDSPHMGVYIARPFNHIGPGQEPSFVVPALCGRIRKADAEATIETGNLDALRDFSDVRDVVRAYRLIIEKRPREKVFVIGSGKSVAVQTVFDLLNQMSGKHITQKVADYLRRDEGTAALVADISLANNVLGWRPEISLEQSIKDVWDATN